MNTLFISPLRRKKARRGSPQRGLSLIETMVGMALGLLITLIITQVWGDFESQKQRTVSGSSAQESGLLALTELEQDIRSAGAGLTDSAAFDCTNTYSYYETGGTTVSPIPAYAGGLAMTPVQITDGGTGSDTLTVKRGADLWGHCPRRSRKPCHRPQQNSTSVRRQASLIMMSLSPLTAPQATAR
ncbi:prepilin-type N-terminal cleavage/methylation domain-containing protein [Polaromonas sp. P1(28)-13]|nr:prepilin-type N-terminal cleavage/methylation domain-containing protein [Polaromonas sp. P1(28)-13]